MNSVIESNSKLSWPSQPLSFSELVTQIGWSCDRQDSIRSLNEVAVMATKASSCSQLTLKRYLQISYVLICDKCYTMFILYKI